MTSTLAELDAGMWPRHLDEAGEPCARHPAATPSSVYQLAMVGSRAPAFHHDCASKLQGLVMALDELSELTEHGDPQLIRAVETALEASRELNALLNFNRTLTRPAPKAAIRLNELIARAAERVGVAPVGSTPAVEVSVGVAPMTHGLALAIDVAAGTGRGRTVAVAAQLTAGQVEITLDLSAQQPANASELLGIAGFVVARDGAGQLWCRAAGDRLVIRLPLAPP